MKAASHRIVHIVALAAVLMATAASFIACGGEAAVTVQPAPTPTRTPDIE